MTESWLEKFIRYVKKTPTCWLWTGPVSHDEGRALFGWKGKTYKAARFIWQKLNGPLPDHIKICHSCDNPRCVRPSHWFAGTQRDNVLDMYSKGRRGGYKLSREEVIEIRRRYKAGELPASIAPDFPQVQYRRVWGICTDRSWKNVG